MRTFLFNEKNMRLYNKNIIRIKKKTQKKTQMQKSFIKYYRKKQKFLIKFISIHLLLQIIIKKKYKFTIFIIKKPLFNYFVNKIVHFLIFLKF